MRVLGIEGTAWAASAAVYDSDANAGVAATDTAGSQPGERNGSATSADAVRIETEAYEPETGGIHPREAAEHMAESIPAVVERVLADEPDGGAEIDAVAFSRGPGLGPCLRVVGTAARALAGRLDVSLVGVNHMLAHLEIGRHLSGFSRPVCLNASGANAHLLAYRGDRYRILGETMDAGVGNALDKFARHVGWSHPGGPKIEERAREGEYVDLPYVVKGMDFSFSGLSSAANEAVDDGVPVADVCRGLEETVFAMLAEVSERALALTGADELVLGGGVGQNDRLRTMLAEMCADRGADFFAPPARFLRDNAGMIAVLGARMAASGDTLPIAESAVRPTFRPDEVPATWRTGESDDLSVDDPSDEPIRGAEATVRIETDRVVKQRRPKEYRHPDLDDRLRRERTRMEARLTSDARRAGVPTPVVVDVDPEASRLVLSRVGRADLAADPAPADARQVGSHLARCHEAGIVHGDPTVRNVRVGDRTWLIDFGLGYHSGRVEDHAMDLHVFVGSLKGTADDAAPLVDAGLDGYARRGDGAVLDRLDAVEERGRYL